MGQDASEQSKWGSPMEMADSNEEDSKWGGMLPWMQLIPAIAGLFTGAKSDKLNREMQQRRYGEGASQDWTKMIMEALTQQANQQNTTQDLYQQQGQAGLAATQLDPYKQAKSLAGAQFLRGLQQPKTSWDPTTGQGNVDWAVNFNQPGLGDQSLMSSLANFNANVARSTGGREGGQAIGDLFTNPQMQEYAQGQQGNVTAAQDQTSQLFGQSQAQQSELFKLIQEILKSGGSQAGSRWSTPVPEWFG